MGLLFKSYIAVLPFAAVGVGMSLHALPKIEPVKNHADMAQLACAFKISGIEIQSQSFVLKGARIAGQHFSGANIIAIRNSEDEVLKVTGLTGAPRKELDTNLATCATRPGNADPELIANAFVPL
jgi:hypothetical protein